MEFSRQEYWSVLPFPFPGDLPDPRIKPTSALLQAVSSKTLDTNQTLLCQFLSSKSYLSFDIPKPLYLCHFQLLVIFLLLDAPCFYIHQQYLHTVSTEDWLMSSNTVILEVMPETWAIILKWMELWTHWVHSLPVTNGARVEVRVLEAETLALEFGFYYPVFDVGLLGPLGPKFPHL